MADIEFEERDRLGLVTLNRPQALNAVTGAMLRALQERLSAWAEDAQIACVAIRAARGRAFSAGGDIRDLYDGAVAGRFDTDFFRQEYALNVAIARYPKPYVAFVDGIAMGGGVGVSFHGSHRVAGEGFAFAMPETGIGFFPDVGASYLLSRLPGAMGVYLGLTGARVKRDDGLALGLATHAASASDFDAVLTRLAKGEAVSDALAPLQREPGGQTPLLDLRPRIDAAFGAPTLPDVLARLRADGSDWALRTLDTLHARAPLSLAVAFEQIRRGASLSLPDCMVMEYRILSRMLRAPDFREGVRAAIVDKDDAPRWAPATLEGVGEAMVAEHFAPAPDGDLRLPAAGAGS